MFDIGDRVVCVEPIGGLVLNHIYTVISVCPHYSDDQPGVAVKEVSATPFGHDHPFHPGFISSGHFKGRRFRKLGRADLLTKLLAEPQPQDERDGKRVVVPKEKV